MENIRDYENFTTIFFYIHKMINSSIHYHQKNIDIKVKILDERANSRIYTWCYSICILSLGDIALKNMLNAIYKPHLILVGNTSQVI